MKRTTVEEFDAQGVLVKRTVTEECAPTPQLEYTPSAYYYGDPLPQYYTVPLPITTNVPNYVCVKQ